MRRAQAEDEVLVDSECKLAARKFIERFGDDAARQASIRAKELRAAGDDEGHESWLSILREIKTISGTDAAPGRE